MEREIEAIERRKLLELLQTAVTGALALYGSRKPMGTAPEPTPGNVVEMPKERSA